MLVKKALTAILAAFLAIGPVQASNEWNDTLVGYVATRPEGVFVVYNNITCPKKIADLIPERFRPGFRLAKWSDPLGTVIGCWAPYESVVLLVWDDNSYGYMMQHEFRLLRAT